MRDKVIIMSMAIFIFLNARRFCSLKFQQLFQQRQQNVLFLASKVTYHAENEVLESVSSITLLEVVV